MDTSPNRSISLALMALGVVATLACVLSIGAATTLVFIALDDAAPAMPMATYDSGCAVVALKSGTTYCFGTAMPRPLRREPVVVANVEPAR